MFVTDSTRSSIGSVRDALRTCLGESVPGARVNDIVLVASELLSNACRHAGGWWCVRLTMARDHLVLSVDDSLPTPPQPRTPDLTGAGGLGWHLIQRLADGVDVQLRSEGKTVHAHWLVHSDVGSYVTG